MKQLLVRSLVSSALIISAATGLAACDNKQPPMKIEESGRADMEKAKAVSDGVLKQDDATRKQIDEQSGESK